MGVKGIRLEMVPALAASMVARRVGKHRMVQQIERLDPDLRVDRRESWCSFTSAASIVN